MSAIAFVLVPMLLVVPSFAAEKETKEPAWLTKLRTEKLDDVQQLQLKRHDKLAEAVVQFDRFIQVGNWDANSLYNVLTLKRQQAEARLELAPAAERVDALTDILESTREMETMIRKRVDAGAERASSLLLSEAATLEIEILIAKEKKKQTK